MAGIKKRLGSLLGPQGKEGATPQFIEGETTQVEPSEPAKVELVEVESGRYRVDAQVPRGLDGDPTAVADLGQAIAVELNTQNSVVRPVLDSTYVSAPQIRRILTSTNPNEPLQDGDLLIVPRTQWFTDFSEHTVGQAPADWSALWRDNSFTVVSDPSGTGGVVLRDQGGATSGRALAWEAVPAASEIEIAMKWRAATSGLPMRPGLRLSGGATTPKGYLGGAQNSSTHSIQGFNGSTTTFTVDDTPGGIQSNTWYISRFRAQGDQISSRTWLATDPEPTTWETYGTDDRVSGPGQVGLYAYSANSSRDVDWVGVAVAGQTAPTGGTL